MHLRNGFMASGDAESMPWHDVPLNIASLWRAIFAASTEGLDLQAPCPVCGNRELHRWFWLARPRHTVEAGRVWLGRGTQWQWCSNCHSYEHTSGLVPDWWRSTLVLPESALRHDPGPLEEARQAI